MSKLKIKAKASNAKMAAALKQIRTDKRLPMRTVAESLDIPHSFIGKTEQQNRRLDVGEFIHYCIALEADPVKVFKQLLL